MSKFESLRGLASLQELLGRPVSQFGLVTPSGSSTSFALSSTTLKSPIGKHHQEQASKRRVSFSCDGEQLIASDAKRRKSSSFLSQSLPATPVSQPQKKLSEFFPRRKSFAGITKGGSFIDAIDVDEEENLTPLTRPKNTMQITMQASVDQAQIVVDLANSNDGGQEAAKLEPDEKPLPAYYLNNFLAIVNGTLEKDSHVFSTEELDLIRQFLNLPEAAARLFVRLYSRKGLRFAGTRLFYKEIADPSTQLTLLGTKGFGRLLSVQQDDLEPFFELMTVDELKNVCRLSGVLKTMPLSDRNREHLLRTLLSAPRIRTLDGTVGLSPKVRAYVSGLLGVLFEMDPAVKALFQRIHRLFFLSNDPDQSYLIILSEKGTIRFPKYEITACRSVYPTREALLEYEEALELGEKLYLALEHSQHDECLSLIGVVAEKLAHISARERSAVESATRLFTSRFSAGWAHSCILTVGVSYLESQKRFEEAVLYLRCLLDCPFNHGKRGDWYERLCLDLEHMGQKDASLLVCEEALGQTIRQSNRIGIEKRYLRLHKPPRRWGQPAIEVATKQLLPGTKRLVFGKRREVATGQKSRFMGYDGQFCSVEELALQHYRLVGKWEGEHCEGSLLVAIWTLLFYDILFLPVPEVFQHKYQVGPLDLSTPSFYLSRQEPIDDRLKRIHSGDVSLLSQNWSAHCGEQCVGLNWEQRPLEQLLLVAECLGGPVLAAICETFALKYGSSRYQRMLIPRSGMPDLLLWEPGSKKAKFAEVKGPNDKLSDKQRVWIDILARSGADVEVCYITEKREEVEEEGLQYPSQTPV